MTFPIEQLPDGQWRVSVESAAGRNKIGPRLWKHSPEKWPDLQDTFDTEALALAKAEEWAAYISFKVAKKRGKR